MGGVKGLPYDAEVEYLEATGTQYIDTQISELYPMSVDIKVCVKAFASSQDVFYIFGGTYYNNALTGTQFRIRGYKNSREITVNHASNNFSFPISLDAIYDIRNDGNDWYVNNELYTTLSPTTSNQSSVHMLLFALYISPNVYLSPATVRIYSAKVSNKDNHVDLIPVRVGTTGYMYDKVSGTLFGNNGTGDFVLGPDIIMTKESNPEVLAICHTNGWAASEDYMTLTEAAAVTNNQLGATFRETNIVHFDEFQYFTSITSLTYNAFLKCQYLKSIKLPYGITIIRNLAFNGTALKEIELPDSVTTLGSSVLANCTSLVKAKLSSNISSSMPSLFENDTNLVTVVMDKNMPITSTGASVFRYCSSLKSVIVPSSVTSIGHYFAQNCSSLESVMVYPTTPPSISSYSPFAGSTCPIYVPAASVDTYKAASGWSTYASRIQAMPT